jgi:Raf kinase inhibitor-like YbhB/YbcL family protein
MVHARQVAFFGVALGAAIVAGCGGPGSSPSAASSGGPSTSAAPAATTSPGTSPSGSEETVMPSESFSLSSAAFADGGSIPSEHTCDGDNVSPPLAWTGVPDGAAVLALIVDDPDAGGFVHWVAFDIDPSSDELAASASTAAGAPAQGRNSFGNVGYGGPCPPSGTHHYRFRLLALGQSLGLSGTPDADAVRAAWEGHVLGEATLTGTYQRGG